MSHFKYFNLFVWITLVAAYYISNAPQSVQTLDTGELVTNAHLLRTIHPPGYPLYSWLYHLFTNYFPVGTVFFKASLLTICFSTISLAIVTRFISKTSYMIAIAVPLCLASTPLFWKYSLLPDIFMLHMLIVCGISYLYLSTSTNSLFRTCLIFIFFALGLANHLTIIFLSPILIDFCWRKTSFKRFAFLTIAALVIFTGFYLSLLLFDHTSMTSWGKIDSIENLISHFLRKDYGTFQLHVSQNPKFYLWDILLHFFNLSNISLAAFAVFALIFAHKIPLKQKESKKLLIYSLCLIFYLFFFFSLANIKPQMTGAEVLERFYLMPIIMLVFIGSYGFSQTAQLFSKRSISLIGILCITATIYNFSNHYRILNYKDNTIIEDWAINRLNSIDTEDTILLESSDTGLFSLYYAQNILKIRPEIPVVSYHLIYHKWYYQRVLKLIPTLTFDWDKHQRTRRLFVGADLLLPNIDKHKFNFSKLITSGDKYHITLLGLGNTIEKGRGVSFNNNSLKKLKFQKSYPLAYAQTSYNQFAAFYAQYVTFFTMKGSLAYQTGDYKKAIRQFKNALKVVPFCSPAFESICLILKKTNDSSHQKCYSELEANFSPIMKEYF